MAAGSTDLAEMLRSLDVIVRPDVYVYACVERGHAVLARAEAQVVEAEGVTVVIRQRDAEAAGLEYEFEARWLTLTVHSSLEAVGLTAAFATALADEGVSCNVLAGFHHDHLLVPVAATGRALDTLRALASDGR